MEKRKIFVLLTPFPGIDSKALRLWTRCSCSHASIGLDEDMKALLPQIRQQILSGLSMIR